MLHQGLSFASKKCVCYATINLIVKHTGVNGEVLCWYYESRNELYTAVSLTSDQKIVVFECIMIIMYIYHILLAGLTTLSHSLQSFGLSLQEKHNSTVTMQCYGTTNACSYTQL